MLQDRAASKCCPHRKIVIVGDQHWEDLTPIFVAEGLRSFPIEYFTSNEQGRVQGPYFPPTMHAEAFLDYFGRHS